MPPETTQLFNRFLEISGWGRTFSGILRKNKTRVFDCSGTHGTTFANVRTFWKDTNEY